MMPNIQPHRLIDRLFRIRRFQYSTYEIDHQEVKGTFRIVTLPTNILEIPNDMLPPNARNPDVPTYMVGSQTIVGFSNRLKKREPTAPVTPEVMKTSKKIELTTFVSGQPFEPWNEYVVQGDPPILIRERTILSRLEWYVDHVNQLGDPSLWAFQNTTQNVSRTESGEAGLT